MATPLKFAGLLLLSSALTAPAAIAQTTPGGTAPGGSDAPAPADATASTPAPANGVADGALSSDAVASGAGQAEEQPEVSVPGGTIVVLGRRGANIQKSAPAVVSVLSSADIARTGEGNIAGALARVTGLSVVGNGFVYVRGLGDRYSLALLNGSPLPSPEPLKRVVPLDLFPTNIVSSSLVQKSYSVNFPGEFGGGVINLTTSAIPKESFLTVSGGIGANSVTTARHGYVHYGAGSDWTGFDNGSRNTPSVLANYWASGQPISSVNSVAIASQLVSPQQAVVQHWGHLPPNFSATISGGTVFDIGEDVRLGVIATAGYSNKWSTRDAIQQYSLSSDLSTRDSDFERVTTDNRIVVNGLLGLGLEFGENKIRWTNLYIRDTLKNTRLGLGRRDQGTADFMVQDTAWYERQLIDTQMVGEYKLTPNLEVDLRGGYANSQREVPNEFTAEYVRTNVATDPFGSFFINRLNNNTGKALIRYSDLNEDLYSAGGDVTFKPIEELSVSAGYAYQNTKRISTRREYAFIAALSQQNVGVGLLRPDQLLSTGVVNAFNIGLQDNEPNPSFRATLVNHAGYGKIGWQITPDILLDAGVRYETAKQTVRSIPVFIGQTAATAPTLIKNDYWLPAATITWQFRPDMQFRVNASKTIARPQFRELIFQQYFDPDTNRFYFGNPYLKDSKLFNAEARYEWYFAREQRLSVSGFYKKIDNPIESFIGIFNGQFATSFANAPKADLYGAEFETQKYFDLSQWSGAKFFESRRLVTIANYTYTKSKLKVTASDRTLVFPASLASPATDYFQNGASLTGQSDHLVNLQLGLEDTDKLSQQTLIMSYASKRVTSRGIRTTGQPDVYEYPGFNLDFVARQGVDIYGKQVDLKFEARNLTNRKYRETQSNGTNTIVYNRYTPGVTVNLSASITF
ncbi:TonB-dependent receptor [soil metagenome]